MERNAETFATFITDELGTDAEAGDVVETSDTLDSLKKLGVTNIAGPRGGDLSTDWDGALVWEVRDAQGYKGQRRCTLYVVDLGDKRLVVKS